MSLTPRHNAILCTGNQPTWFYFNRPTHTAFHDLTLPSTRIPRNIKSLLGLGLKFCPVPKYTTRDPSLNLNRFERNLLCKTYFGFDPDDPRREDYNPKFYSPSNWVPAPWMIPNTVISRLEKVASAIYNAYHQKQKRRRTENLLPHQKYILNELRIREDILVVKCDKIWALQS